MQGSAEPPTTSDFPLEVAFFCPTELARFARSRALATLATSRGCRLFSASGRAILPALPLRPCHLPECLRLQPPRHPYGSLARLSSGARSLRSLTCARPYSATGRGRSALATLREPGRPLPLPLCSMWPRGARSLRSLAWARYARPLAGMSPVLRVRPGNSARSPSPPMPPPRMPQVTTTPAPSHRIFRSRPQAVLELHVLSSGASLFRRMLSVTTAFPPHLPHISPTSHPRLPHVSPADLFRPGRASALPRLRTAPQYGKTSVFGQFIAPLSII